MTALPLVHDTAPITDTSFAITWAVVDAGLWSGSADGEFIGIVERLDATRFRAVNGVGDEVAICRTLADAKARLLHPASRRVVRRLRLVGEVRRG
jgi:hypothetical protein